jgi:uncharacterized protein YciU (UPF0263 family)
MKTEILLHNIEFNWRDGNELRQLSETDEEHIKNCIKDEYIEGELNQFDHENQKEIRGWWNIVK